MRDELAEGPCAVADVLLDVGIEFTEGLVKLTDEEVGIVSETV